MLIALVLPPLLVHRMDTAEYGAWVLILQCSGYVNLLDLGLQAAIGKFVAEYHARGDRAANSRILSSSFALLCLSSVIGALGIAILVWRVPQLFDQMPIGLVGSLRLGILAVGLSAVIALPFGAFLAVFTGLQEYGFPTALALISKLSSSAALVAVILMHGNLVQMACALALFNMATAFAQFLGWRKYARDRVGFSWAMVGRAVALRLAKYGSVLSIWNIAMLLVSGLDIVIVGHYDYKNAGYYGITTSVTNFMVVVISSLFGPLLPAVSSLQSGRTPRQIGDLTIKTTRYCALLVCLVGLPLIFGAFPLLNLWVGRSYASRSAIFLEALVLGNGLRQLLYPYGMVVIATGKQHLATLAGVVEAIVNLGISIYLVQRIGAVGVAIGTVVGALVSVAVHMTVSMRLTRGTIAMSRTDFLRGGILRPLMCAAPSLLLLPFLKQNAMLPFHPALLAVWIAGTLGIAWFGGLTSEERGGIERQLSGWYTGPKRERTAI